MEQQPWYEGSFFPGFQIAVPQGHDWEIWEIQGVVSIRTDPTGALPQGASTPQQFASLTSIVAYAVLRAGPGYGRGALMKLRLLTLPGSISDAQQQALLHRPVPESLAAFREMAAIERMAAAQLYPAPSVIGWHRCTFSALPEPRMHAHPGIAIVLMLAVPFGRDCRDIEHWPSLMERMMAREEFLKAYRAFYTAGLIHTRPDPEHVIWDPIHEKVYIMGLGNVYLGQRDRVMEVDMIYDLLTLWGLRVPLP
ncbi:uncharacterized protein BO97DRAFT_465830 [Aspergillus homomorphus CBS 101889]|uniref:Uncharacterized protein n=1 Tax=Aspergillus homomorphus (strain CBS 101889) TaxID=1450537 RepID=A0A395I3D8_ASPHC|nr:hypothetical protein BO97DRAFT_465830 [Aspergillus homomorphus CBS 101889]RAL14219.1 hypothetical protein BO97DRAFT_465830 [Aspergillus homomorphus CBS 101889]